MKSIKILCFVFGMQFGTSLVGLPTCSFSHALEFSAPCWSVIWFTLPPATQPGSPLPKNL